MKNKITLLVFFIYISSQCYCQVLKQEYQTQINIFIGHVINDDSKELAKLISYPLSRKYPNPDIKNQQEFILRYNEIFDDSLKNLIIDSDPATDWDEVGWRGIMLYNGTMWIDTDGKIIAINYQSNTEKEIQKHLIEIDRNKLYPSLIIYKNPVYILETSKFRIRIDQLSNDKYRYASWPITKPMSEAPDLIINNGEVFMEGSGGNHRFEFKNGIYLYECAIWLLRGSETAPADLIVSKNDVVILTQDAEIINP